MIELKSNRIRVTKNATGVTNFDTDNPMPHLLGQAAWSGVLSTGSLPYSYTSYQVFHPGHWSSSYYWGWDNFDSEVLIPLGINVANADFLFGKIIINGTSSLISTPYEGQYGTLLYNATKLYKAGVNYPLNGTFILLTTTYSPAHTTITLIISLEIKKIGDYAFARFVISTRYFSHTIQGNFSQNLFAINAKIDLSWGKFPT